MKQQIAIDFNTMERLVKSCGKTEEPNIENMSLMNAFQKMIKEYHCIVKDKHMDNNSSIWDTSCLNLSNELKNINQEIKKFFDAFYIQSRQESISCFATKKNSFVFEELADATPDKILIKDQASRNETAPRGINYYDIETFTSKDNFKLNCLLRKRKTFDLEPGYLLKNLNIIAPYVRYAKKIEFCDPYLFHDKSKSDTYFLLEIIKKCEELNSLIIRYESSSIDVRYCDFLKELAKIKKMEVKRIPYNKSPNHNHDRFIIVDHNEYSIKFTTSFNNLIYQNGEQFKINKAMTIIFTEGRNYFD